jgi:hypothetical protein
MIKEDISRWIINGHYAKHSITCMSDCRREFGLVIGFIEHLQIVTISNYGAIANTHTLQFTTTRIKSFQSTVSSPVVAW